MMINFYLNGLNNVIPKVSKIYRKYIIHPSTPPAGSHHFAYQIFYKPETPSGLDDYVAPMPKALKVYSISDNQLPTTPAGSYCKPYCITYKPEISSGLDDDVALMPKALKSITSATIDYLRPLRGRTINPIATPINLQSLWE